MGNIIYLEEIRIKKDIAAAMNELKTARTLSTQGIDIPKNIFNKLEQKIDNLENKLRNYILGTN